MATSCLASLPGAAGIAAGSANGAEQRVPWPWAPLQRPTCCGGLLLLRPQAEQRLPPHPGPSAQRLRLSRTLSDFLSSTWPTRSDLTQQAMSRCSQCTHTPVHLPPPRSSRGVCMHNASLQRLSPRPAGRPLRNLALRREGLVIAAIHCGPEARVPSRGRSPSALSKSQVHHTPARLPGRTARAAAAADHE